MEERNNVNLNGYKKSISVEKLLKNVSIKCVKMKNEIPEERNWDCPTFKQTKNSFFINWLLTPNFIGLDSWFVLDLCPFPKIIEEVIIYETLLPYQRK